MLVFQVGKGYGCGGEYTFWPLLLAALMRDVMLAMFSVSCFARWALKCISSAMAMFEFKKSRVDAGIFPCMSTSVSSPTCGALHGLPRLTCADEHGLARRQAVW